MRHALEHNTLLAMLLLIVFSTSHLNPGHLEVPDILVDMLQRLPSSLQLSQECLTCIRLTLPSLILFLSFSQFFLFIPKKTWREKRAHLVQYASDYPANLYHNRLDHTDFAPAGQSYITAMTAAVDQLFHMSTLLHLLAPHN